MALHKYPSRKEYMRKWRAENRERYLTRNRKYYEEHKEKQRAWRRKWYSKHREQRLIAMKKWRTKLKIKVVFHYSNGTMACADPLHLHLANDPFATDITCLSIDHIEGNGAKERKELDTEGQAFYSWLIKNNYPEGYQVLCMNCQWKKRQFNNEA